MTSYNNNGFINKIIISQFYISYSCFILYEHSSLTFYYIVNNLGASRVA